MPVNNTYYASSSASTSSLASSVRSASSKSIGKMPMHSTQSHSHSHSYSHNSSQDWLLDVAAYRDGLERWKTQERVVLVLGDVSLSILRSLLYSSTFQNTLLIFLDECDSKLAFARKSKTVGASPSVSSSLPSHLQARLRDDVVEEEAGIIQPDIRTITFFIDSAVPSSLRQATTQKSFLASASQIASTWKADRRRASKRNSRSTSKATVDTLRTQQLDRNRTIRKAPSTSSFWSQSKRFSSASSSSAGAALDQGEANVSGAGAETPMFDSIIASLGSQNPMAIENSFANVFKSAALFVTLALPYLRGHSRNAQKTTVGTSTTLVLCTPPSAGSDVSHAIDAYLRPLHGPFRNLSAVVLDSKTHDRQLPVALQHQKMTCAEVVLSGALYPPMLDETDVGAYFPSWTKCRFRGLSIDRRASDSPTDFVDRVGIASSHPLPPPPALSRMSQLSIHSSSSGSGFTSVPRTPPNEDLELPALGDCHRVFGSSPPSSPSNSRPPSQSGAIVKAVPPPAVSGPTNQSSRSSGRWRLPKMFGMSKPVATLAKV